MFYFYVTIEFMKILITGVNGFVGHHLTRELKKRGVMVYGLGRETKLSGTLTSLLDEYWACDLLDKLKLSSLALEEIDAIINLAGLAKVADSFSDPDKYKTINVGVMTNLGEALLEKNLSPRILAISTGTVYDPNQTLPLNEDSKLITEGSPYTLSKILMEEASEKLRAKGLDVVTVRPFNHVGPGQEEGFLIPDLYAKLAGAKKSGEPIKVGNLGTKRDYTDVRDVVRAYADLVMASDLRHSLYNVASGKSVAGTEILDILSNLLNFPVTTEIDKSLIRPSDIMDIYGSYKRLNQEIAWTPKIELHQTLKDFIAAKQL